MNTHPDTGHTFISGPALSPEQTWGLDLSRTREGLSALTDADHVAFESARARRAAADLRADRAAAFMARATR